MEIRNHRNSRVLSLCLSAPAAAVLCFAAPPQSVDELMQRLEKAQSVNEAQSIASSVAAGLPELAND